MRAVVGEQRIVVAVHEEAARRSGYERRAHVGPARYSLSRRQPHSHFIPFCDRQRDGHLPRRLTAAVAALDLRGDAARGIGSDAYFTPPRFARRPAMAEEVIGD